MGLHAYARLLLCCRTDGGPSTPLVSSFSLFCKLCRFRHTNRLTRQQGVYRLCELRALRTGSVRLETDSAVPLLGEPRARTPLVPQKYR
jgi:hypothetical protein